MQSDAGPFRVVGVNEETVKVDFNHPMAGRTLKFEVEVMVQKSKGEELLHGHAHGPGGYQH